jgi:hypothetical protein
VGNVNPAIALTAAILGSGLAAGAHAVKSGSRVLINTSPEPFTNWTASIAEDIAVVGGLWTALYYPWLFLVLMIVFIGLMIWLMPKIWGVSKRSLAISDAYSNMRKGIILRRTADRGKNLLRKPNNIIVLS